MSDLQEITKTWVDGVLDYYKNFDNLNQVYARGYFAGMSDRDVMNFVNRLSKNANDYPSWDVTQDFHTNKKP